MTSERVEEIRASSADGSMNWDDPIGDARFLLAELDRVTRERDEAQRGIKGVQTFMADDLRNVLYDHNNPLRDKPWEELLHEVREVCRLLRVRAALSGTSGTPGERVSVDAEMLRVALTASGRDPGDPVELARCVLLAQVTPELPWPPGVLGGTAQDKPVHAKCWQSSPEIWEEGRADGARGMSASDNPYASYRAPEDDAQTEDER